MKDNLTEQLNHAIHESPASLLEISWSLEITPERLTELRAGLEPTTREEILIRKMISKILNPVKAETPADEKE
jgi:hypothetical protein